MTSPGAVPLDPPVRRVGSLSPSRASDFLQCPLLFRFRTVDRLPEKPSPVAIRGTLVHSVLERLFDAPRGGRTLAAALDLVAPEWERLIEAEPEAADAIEGDKAEWLATATPLLETYFRLEDPTRLEPAERELRVECTLDDGLVLRGYVDRLDLAPATGDMRVVDYKTGKAPRNGFEDKAMFQMRFYALVLWRARGDVPKLLQLLYLGSGEFLRYEPDEADLLATERKLIALAGRIDQSLTSGDFRPNKSKLCDWCDHRALCPAWGGTPPPMPDLDAEGVLQSPAPSASEED